MSFTYQPNKKCIYFRHYKVVIKQGGVRGSFKQLVKESKSDISQFKNFADYLKAQNGNIED